MYYLIGYITLFCIYHYICPLNYATKYFFAHIIHNLLVMLYTFPVILNVLNNPIQENMYQFIPQEFCSFLAALHIYHLIFYKISYDEIYHHILSIYFHFYPLNKFLLASLFFMTGLPGGLTYLMLILVKYGYIQKITEKKISKNLNLWCRMPGILFFASLLFLNIYHNYKRGNTPSPQDLITLFFMVWNPIHFTKTIVESTSRLEENNHSN
jgi:hypothetical protein